ncbi:MAG: right-handed parallel beta-helix repeat-containing protein, partial [Thermoplasmata archaeon]|nr:right-handed parallel beta-helix repeat-containing protein [Thermoplasmata archaeon]
KRVVCYGDYIIAAGYRAIGDNMEEYFVAKYDSDGNIVWQGNNKNYSVSIVYVDDDYDSSNHGWQRNHFNKIQDGIDAVAENGTVYVFNGTYYENIVINKSITLIGEDRNTTIIDGNYKGDVIKITADNVSINGFEIRHSRCCSSGIEISYANNVTISNCSISNNSYGISLDSSSNNTLSNCNIYGNNFDGILIRHSFNNYISSCDIYENNEYGIYLYSSSNNTISNSNIYSNKIAGILIIASSMNNTVDRCNVSDNAFGVTIGIEGGYSLNNTISNCNFTNDGLLVLNSGNYILNNTVNGKPLLYYVNEENVSINGIEAGEIILVNCSNFGISNINITNTDVGIEIVGGKDNKILSVNLSHNLYGIILFVTKSVYIENISSYDNYFENFLEGYGIAISGSDNVDIYNCNIHNNNYGVNIGNSYNVTIHYNNIYNNSAYGIVDWTEGSINASYNYWGSPSGPYNDVFNPNGTGDNVSDNVIFKPWLTAPVKGGKEEKIQQGENEINAIDETDAIVKINTTQNTTAKIISYEEPPVEEPDVVKSVGKYTQIEVENESAVKWPIFIQIYYTQEDLDNAGISEDKLLGIYFYNETSKKWELYNDTGINTTDVVVNGKQYAGYAYAYAWHLTNLTIGGDVIPPEIRNVTAIPEKQKINGFINITCIVTDNVEMGDVKVNITYPDGSYHNLSMQKIGNTYYYNATYSMIGNYTYFIWANDSSGNENISCIKSFSMFTLQYTLKTSVSPSGAGYITLNPSGGKYDEGTVVTATAVANSGYVFDHWGGDASGTNPTIQITMDENKSIVAYFVAIPSNQPPTITITSPSNGATVSGTVTIQGTAGDSDGTVQKVEVKIDNGAWTQATGTTEWSYSLNTTVLSNGEHTIYARSFDGADYSSSASITINIFNNHKPVIVIVSPENGSIVKGTIVVNGTASDEDGNDTITKVEIRIDNGTWNVANGTISWNYTINTKELKNGMHVIGARAYDGHDYSNIVSIQIEVKNEERTPGFEIVLLFASVMIIYFLKRKQY